MHKLVQYIFQTLHRHEDIYNYMILKVYILPPFKFIFSQAMLNIQGFWCFVRSRSREMQVNPRNPAKFTKTCKIPQNSVEILSNTCLYNNFETCLSYWGYLLAVNSQIYVKTSSLKCANNVPKLPGIDYVAKNWALARMLKALPLVHF